MRAIRWATLLLAAFAFYAFWIEPRRLTVTRLEIAAPGLAAPVKIVAFGDTQSISWHWGPERLKMLAARINAEEPDLIVMLGDAAGIDHGPFAWLYNDRLFVPPEAAAEAFAGLRAPMGAYGVLGNHDWWWNGERLSALMEGAGLRMLRNQGVEAVHPATGARLWMAGIEDRASLYDAPDWAAALKGAPEGLPVLALAHRPDEAAALPRPAALVLAGHAHGGQICLPAGICPVKMSRFGWIKGLHQTPGGPLAVTRGVGTAMIPARMFAAPEILVVTLRP